MNTTSTKQKRRGRPEGTGPYGEKTKVIRVPPAAIGPIKTALKGWLSSETLSAASPASLAPNQLHLPLYLSPVVAGFPSAADDHIDQAIDLHELLIKNPPATFYVRVKGDSMIEAGILSGDVLVVDRSLNPVHRKIIIAAVNGEFTVKRLIKRKGRAELHAENKAYPPIILEDDQELEVLGVVTGVIRDKL